MACNTGADIWLPSRCTLSQMQELCHFHGEKHPKKIVSIYHKSCVVFFSAYWLSEINLMTFFFCRGFEFVQHKAVIQTGVLNELDKPLEINFPVIQLPKNRRRVRKKKERKYIQKLKHLN